MPANNVQQEVFDHIKKVCVFSDLTVTPRIYTDFTHSPLASMLLGQIVYWSDVTKHADGYFWKSIPEWQQELGFSYHQVTYCLEKLINLGVITTCLRPIAHRLTTHYKLNLDRLIELIDQAAAKQPVAIAPDPVAVPEDTTITNDCVPSNFGGDPPKSEVVLTLNYPLNNTLTREVKESVCTLASLACASGQKSPAIAAAPQPVAVDLFSPTMQVDLTFANQLQPTLLDLPPISEFTRPPDTNTEKITIRNKTGGMHPPKLPKGIMQDRKHRDPILEHPALKKYFAVSRHSIPVCMRQDVTETVGDDPAKVALWEKVVKEWVGSGYNPRNIIGMLEAFKAGGLSKNGNSNRNGNNKTTPSDVHYAPSDPVEHMKSITPPDIWEKLGGDVRLAQAWQQVHYNPRWRETILKNDVEELKAAGVDRF